MIITVTRKHFNEKCTIGELDIDGKFQCYTLEDTVRPYKIKGVTAIPTGEYKVIINQSNRFKRLLPLLINVPNFEGVRIHAGNTSEDTEGCILVGEIVSLSKNAIVNSRVAFNKLFEKMQKADSITLIIK